MNNIRYGHLPEVGDRIMTAPTYHITEPELETCVVTYVNTRNNYYTVKFDKTGILESYKLYGMDDMSEISEFKENYKRAFGVYPKGVYVYESGALYKTIKNCAEAIGVTPGVLFRHLRGVTSNANGYHVYLL